MKHRHLDNAFSYKIDVECYLWETLPQALVVYEGFINGMHCTLRRGLIWQNQVLVVKWEMDEKSTPFSKTTRTYKSVSLSLSVGCTLPNEGPSNAEHTHTLSAKFVHLTPPTGPVLGTRG